MDSVALDVQIRDKTQKAKKLLAEGLIPLEFYGKGVENHSLQVDYQTFRRTFIKAGQNTIIQLKIEGKDQHDVLVHDITYNPVTDLITHVDFINIEKGKEITTKVPLEFVGMSLAVKDEGGTLMTHLTEVEIKCLPKDLIHVIEVSIDSLVDFNSFIRIKDLIVPDTITITNELEDLVVTAVPPAKIEEELPVETEEEGEEGAEGEAPAEEGEEGKAEEKKAEGGE